MKNRMFVILVSCFVLILGVTVFAVFLFDDNGSAGANPNPSAEVSWDSQVTNHNWYYAYNNNDADDLRYGGITYEGTQVFDVYNARDLAAVSYMTNHNGRTFAGKTVRIMNDIDLGDYQWIPMGSDSNSDSFSGTLDGNGCTITGFSPVLTNNMIGFIGQAAGNAVVKNLTLRGQITVLDAELGGTVRCAPFAAKVRQGESHSFKADNCQNYVEIITSAVTQNTNLYVAGIVSSEPETSVEITRCINYSDITFSGAEGAVAGLAVSAVNVAECANYGNINVESDGQKVQTAGLVGTIFEGTICNSYNMGDIRIINGRAGGIVSYISNTSAVEIYNCVNAGDIIVTSFAGGETVLGGIAAKADFSGIAIDFYNNVNYGRLSAQTLVSSTVLGGILGKVYVINDANGITVENAFVAGITREGSQTVGSILGGAEYFDAGVPAVYLSHCFVEEGSVSTFVNGINNTVIENCGFVIEDGGVDMHVGFDIDSTKSALELLDEHAQTMSVLGWNELNTAERTVPFLYAARTIHKFNFDGTWTAAAREEFDNFKNELPQPETHEGWVFIGYSPADDSAEIAYRAAKEVVIAGETNLYEIWELESDTIKYLNSDGSNAEVPVNALTEWNASDIGYVFPLPFSSIPGWNFLRWEWVTSSIDEETQEEVEVRETVTMITAEMLGQDLRLEAKYDYTTYTINYNLSSEPAVTFDLENYTPGEPALLQLAVPTREGYDFKGWCRTENTDGDSFFSINIIDEAGAMDITGETTVELWPKWERKKYTVTFHLNDGSIEPVTHLFEYDLVTPIPADIAKERPGYTFEGWSRLQDWRPEVNGSIDYPADGSVDFSVKSEETFYAGWTPKIYKLRFFMDPPTYNIVEDREQEYESEIDFPKPEREHYTFAGWIIVYHDGVKYTTKLENFHETKVPLGGIILGALWNAHLYEITFETNGGTALNNIERAHGSPIHPLETAKTDCSFAGWYTDAEFTNGFDSIMPTHDITLYAKWELDFEPLKKEYDKYLEKSLEEDFDKKFGNHAKINEFRAALTSAREILDNQETAELSELTAARVRLQKAGVDLGIARPDGALIDDPNPGNNSADIWKYVALAVAVLAVLFLCFVRRREAPAEKTAVAPASVDLRLPPSAPAPARPAPVPPAYPYGYDAYGRPMAVRPPAKPPVQIAPNQMPRGAVPAPASAPLTAPTLTTAVIPAPSAAPAPATPPMPALDAAPAPAAPGKTSSEPTAPDEFEF